MTPRLIYQNQHVIITQNDLVTLKLDIWIKIYSIIDKTDTIAKRKDTKLTNDLHMRLLDQRQKSLIGHDFATVNKYHDTLTITRVAV